jgi:hypothetical protein
MSWNASRARPCLRAALLILLAGCSRPSHNYDPPADKARDALVAALDAWKAGKECNRIVDRSPFIEVVDFYWDTGVRLTSYEIADEDTSEDGHHRFTVNLHVEEARSVQKVAYIVLGQNPLWVYREEDYKKTSGTEGM